LLFIYWRRFRFILANALKLEKLVFAVPNNNNLNRKVKFNKSKYYEVILLKILKKMHHLLKTGD